jgi:putative transposase
MNEATIKKYIREQENVDQIIDKISVKELKDPFRGS